MKPTIRRSLTLRWLHNQTPDMIGILREYYADHLSVPIIETCERFESEEEVEWVWSQFGREVCAFSGVECPKMSVGVTRAL